MLLHLNFLENVFLPSFPEDLHRAQVTNFGVAKCILSILLGGGDDMLDNQGTKNCYLSSVEVHSGKLARKTFSIENSTTKGIPGSPHMLTSIRPTFRGNIQFTKGSVLGTEVETVHCDEH